MRTCLLTCFFLLITITAWTQTRVYVLPTVHGMHQQNTRYNYDSIRAMVERISPDVVAVEIRPEDEAGDTAYLKQNYPREMWMMHQWLPNTMVKGFDWLGQDVEGKAIPANYWKEQSRIKALQKMLSADSSYQQKLKACAVYTDQRLPALQNGSVQDILKADAILVRSYYECLNRQLQGSPYAELTAFYRQRDHHIQQRVLSIIRNHPGKTIAILTGADHYPYLVDILRREKELTLMRW